MLGRMYVLSATADALDGRKAARRKINLLAAILSGDTTTVRLAIVRFSPAVAFCCSRWRLRCHFGPSIFSHSV